MAFIRFDRMTVELVSLSSSGNVEVLLSVPEPELLESPPIFVSALLLVFVSTTSLVLVLPPPQAFNNRMRPQHT